MTIKRFVNKLRGRAPAVLVVCSGNTCRSPMGEWLIRDRFAVGPVWSRGTAWSPGSMAGHAVQVLVRQGFDRTALENHRAAPILMNDVVRADVVIAMTAGHAGQIRQLAARLPWWRRPDVVTLDIPDPFGGDAALYGVTAERIVYQVRERARFGRREA